MAEEGGDLCAGAAARLAAGLSPAAAGARRPANRPCSSPLACAQSPQVHSLGPADAPGLPAACYKALVVGQQAVCKGRQGSSARNKVQVLKRGMGAVLLPTSAAGLLLLPAFTALPNRCLLLMSLLPAHPCCPSSVAGHAVRGAPAAARQRRPAHPQLAHLDFGAVGGRGARRRAALLCFGGLRAWPVGRAAAGWLTRNLLSRRSHPAGAGFKGAHLTAPALFRRILATFTINDWSLFGADGGGAAAAGP